MDKYRKSYFNGYMSKQASAADKLLQLGAGGLVGGLGGLAYGGYDVYKDHKAIDNFVNQQRDIHKALWAPFNRLSNGKTFQEIDKAYDAGARAGKQRYRSEIMPGKLIEKTSIGAGIGVASVGAAQVMAALLDKIKGRG